MTTKNDKFSCTDEAFSRGMDIEATKLDLAEMKIGTVKVLRGTAVTKHGRNAFGINNVRVENATNINDAAKAIVKNWRG